MKTARLSFMLWKLRRFFYGDRSSLWTWFTLRRAGLYPALYTPAMSYSGEGAGGLERQDRVVAVVAQRTSFVPREMGAGYSPVTSTNFTADDLEGLVSHVEEMRHSVHDRRQSATIHPTG